MYHSLFIHFVYQKTSGYFQVLTVMNKATINIHVWVLCGHKFSAYLGKSQGVRLLDHMVRGCLIFQETAKLSSK